MAMVLLPFALYGVLLLKSKPKIGAVALSLSLASILLTHNLSGMISIGIVFLFGLLFERSLKMLKAISISIVGSVGLSAFYILPAFFEKGFTRIEETITTGYFDYHNHFVALRQFLFGTWGYGGSIPGLEDGISFALGWLPIILMFIAFIGIFLFHKKVSNAKSQLSKALILLFFLAGSLFMATNKSVFIWDHIEMLKFMQFPWRFLSFAHVFIATLAGGMAFIFSKKQLFGTGLCVLVMVVAIGMNGIYFQPEKYIQNTDEFYSTTPEFIQRELSKTLNDYLPKTIKDDHFPTPPAARISGPSVHITKDTPSQVTASTDCQTSCTVVVNIFQFPGWKAWIDGKEAQLVIKNDFPTYTISVPSGSHTLSVQLTGTPVRRTGNILTILTLLGFVIFYGRNKKSQRIS